jgi:hypothetical protein
LKVNSSWARISVRNIHILPGFVLLLVTVAFCGCGRHRAASHDITSDAGHSSRTSRRLSNIEVERRINDYYLDLDSAANLGEFFTAVADGLDIEIVVDAERISPETPIGLENSRESLVIQILEYVTAATRTRYEIRKGKIWIKDGD